MKKIEKSKIFQIIELVILIILSTHCFYFMIFVRSEYRDNEGNYAGTAILVGLICLYFIFAFLKSSVLGIDDFLKYYYILICIWALGMMFIYKSKLCMSAFLLFFILLRIFYFVDIKIPFLCRKKWMFYLVNFIGSISSIIIHYGINSNHDGLYIIAKAKGNAFFILAVLVINIIGALLVEDIVIKKRGYSIYSAYLVLLYCLGFDVSFTKLPLLLFCFVLPGVRTIINSNEFEKNNREKEEKIEFKYRFLKSVLCSYAIFVPYCILGPMEIYAGNQTELLFPYYHFLVPLILLTAIFSIIIGVIVAVSDIHDIICASMVIFGFISWIQAMFLNKVLFDINGHSIEWGKQEALKKTNIYLWILLVVILHIVYSVMYMKFRKKNIEVYVAIPLVLIQMVAVVSLLLTTDPNRDAPWVFEGSDEMKVGRKDNIIVFILDAFGQESLSEVAKTEPEVMNVFKDFTIYSDCNSTYNGTFPSITYMFTNEHVPDENGFNKNKYIDKAYASDFYNQSFDRIHKNGYKISYYNYGTSLFGKYKNVENRFDNVSSIISKVKYDRLIYLFMRMSAYRYMPYVVKPYLETETDEFLGGGVFYSDNWSWPVADNGEFYERLVNEKLSFSENDKEIKIYHLFGLHSPFKTDRNCVDVGNQTKIDTVYGLQKLLQTYFDELERLGIYDDSTIIIMADHGGMLSDSDLFPILLIKNRNQVQSQYGLCDIPVDSKDFIPTILSLVGENEYNDFGMSIFDNNGSTRDRVFYMKNDETDYTKYIYNGNNSNLLKQIYN